MDKNQREKNHAIRLPNWHKYIYSIMVLPLELNEQKHICLEACVETLEEVAIGLKESFFEAGGKKFTYVPCLNSSEDSIDLLQKLVLNELGGWVPE